MRLAIIAIFAGFGLIVLGMLALLAFDNVIAYRVGCERGADVCVLEQERLQKTSSVSVPLRIVTGAAVDTARGGRGQGERTFLMLVTGDKRVFAAEYEGWNAREHAEGGAREVMTFLGNPVQRTIALEVTNPWLYAAAWIGGALALLLVFGGGVVAFRAAGRRQGFTTSLSADPLRR
jgi:hypothetical protein